MGSEFVFKREISLTSKIDGDLVVSQGRLSDSYHEMEATVKFTFPALVITSLETKLIRFPHQECNTYTNHINKLVGVRANRTLFESIMEKTGFPRGCAHMNNLIYQLGIGAVQARFAKWDEFAPKEWESLPEPQRVKSYLEAMPAMIDACSAWASDSPMLIRARNYKG
jgi:hypothetical protein